MQKIVFSTWWFKSCLFLGVVCLVGIVLFLTPLPDLHFASCDRPCHELDWPMICRFRITLEQHQPLGGLCGDCPANISHCFRFGCMVAEGNSKRILTANKQLPGPSIQVCQNDIILVDVVNRLPGQGVAIHWRGQKQFESPYMDGVPMITQCPISSYTTFQYKFRASEAGTHLWQSHTGNEILDGIFGALVVRKADRTNEHRRLYDIDDKSHMIILNQWKSSVRQSEGAHILVNGIASNNDALVPILKVNKGLKYRIRVAHAGDGNACPFFVSLKEHQLLIISLDGNPIVPIYTKSIEITQGERFDFIMDASKEGGEYKLEVRSNCTKSIGVAKFIYNTTVDEMMESESIEPMTGTVQTSLVSTVFNKKCAKDSNVMCIQKIHSFDKMPSELAKEKMDVTLYLPFDYLAIAAGAGKSEAIPRMDNITFMFPSSPLVSQYDDTTYHEICRKDRLPDRCMNEQVCECVHTIHIPLKAKVEIILINQDKVTQADHVFHLHGHHFHVVGVTDNVKEQNVEVLKHLDEKGLLMKRNLLNPIVKDTVAVPRNGAVALRFIANNPGYWLLHDQSASQWASGLDVVLKVGENYNLPSVPDNFPKCGSWVGPQFFLI
ncbi:laccase-2-like isoform X2 [Cimex lectularius]|uniref:Multicopper oxidase n=1 Tax=Cimex lectularius TaxID=79782 RepID=A0A8I6RB59_CIMLE|nr:laccase-2-like isoform X2 [Cimex lectularius]